MTQVQCEQHGLEAPRRPLEKKADAVERLAVRYLYPSLTCPIRPGSVGDAAVIVSIGSLRTSRSNAERPAEANRTSHCDEGGDLRTLFVVSATRQRRQHSTREHKRRCGHHPRLLFFADLERTEIRGRCGSAPDRTGPDRIVGENTALGDALGSGERT